MHSQQAEARLGIVVFCAALLLIGGCCGIKAAGGLNILYSEGSRSGTVIKISRKGWVWQTWEGELDLHRLKSSAGENPTTESAIFHFSVSSDAVAEEVAAAERSGLRTTLRYRQYLLRGWKYGGTSYDITSVEIGDSAVPVRDRFSP